MYSSFLFLLLVFLIPSLSQGLEKNLISSSGLAFTAGISIYFFTLLIIVLQNYYFHKTAKAKKSKMLFVVNVELTLFLLIYYFVLNSNRLIQDNLHFQFFSYLTAIILYLAALWLFHYTTDFFSLKMQPKRASKEIIFLLPFIIPFLFFSLLVDLVFSSSNLNIDVFLSTSSPFVENLILICLFLSLILLTMIFFPFIIQRIWQCRPLSEEDPELTEKLEAICRAADFRHAGIKTWTIMNDAMTAAIIGVIPQIRYVIFTRKLIHKLSFNAISAILAHEIGHSFRWHLAFYPFIMVGLFLILNALESSFEGVFPSFIFFSIYTMTVVLYFRFVFGFFSRNFERQADLHVYALKMDPKFMVEALDDLAKASGNSHLVPCWHHYSIKERIDFINQTIENPALIEKHHAFVKKALFFYFIIIILLFSKSMQFFYR